MKHLNFKKLICSILAFALAFTLASCTQEKPPEETSTASVTHFIVNLDNNISVLVDANGNEIMRSEYMNSPNGYYSNSAEVPFVVVWNSDVVTDENGRETEISLSALYSIDGTLLQDFQECSYTAAFGDFIIRTNYYMADSVEQEELFSDLINAYTGEVLYHNIDQVSVQEENFIVLYNTEMKIAAIVDSSGAAIDGLSLASSYYSIDKYGDYFLGYTSRVDNETGYPIYEIFILNEQLEPISSAYYSIISCAPYFLAERDDNMVDVIDPATGKVIFQEQFLLYYGDDYYIYRVYLENYESLFVLHNSNGTRLTSSTSYFAALPAEEDKPLRFYFVSSNNADVICIDKNGEVLAQQHFSNDTYYVEVCGNLLSVSVLPENEYVQQTCFLVDADLNVIDLDGRVYTSIYALSHNDNRFHAYYTTEQGFSAYDILDANGNVLLEISDIQYSVEGYLVVTQGAYAGVVDVDGNWLFRTEY